MYFLCLGQEFLNPLSMAVDVDSEAAFNVLLEHRANVNAVDKVCI
jgi:hypothetical protein